MLFGKLVTLSDLGISQDLGVSGETCGVVSVECDSEIDQPVGVVTWSTVLVGDDDDVLIDDDGDPIKAVKYEFLNVRRI